MANRVDADVTGRALGARLLAVRRTGVVRRKICALTGTTTGTVVRWEHGRVRPDEVPRLCAALDYLAGEVDEPPRERSEVDTEARAYYVGELDELTAELRFRLRAAGLRPTPRDYQLDRYVPQRGAVSVLWHLLDQPAPDLWDLDVLLRAARVMERYVPPPDRVDSG